MQSELSTEQINIQLRIIQHELQSARNREKLLVQRLLITERRLAKVTVQFKRSREDKDQSERMAKALFGEALLKKMAMSDLLSLQGKTG